MQQHTCHRHTHLYHVLVVNRVMSSVDQYISSTRGIKGGDTNNELCNLYNYVDHRQYRTFILISTLALYSPRCFRRTHLLQHKFRSKRLNLCVPSHVNLPLHDIERPRLDSSLPVCCRTSSDIAKLLDNLQKRKPTTDNAEAGL